MLQLGGKVVTWAATVVFARELLPLLSIRPRLFAKEPLRALFAYGSKTFGINISNLVIARIDLAVIGAFLGVSLNTFYSVGRALVDYAAQLCTTFGWSFTMHFADLHGRSASAELTNLFLRGTRFAALMGFGLAAYIAVFGGSFIGLWVGPEFLTGPWTRRSDVILLLFIVAQLPRWMQIMSWQLLQGTGRVKFPMVLSMSEAAANLAFSLLLVRPLGLAGVALGTLVPSVIAHGMILPLYVIRVFELPASRFAREGYARAAMVGVLCAVFAWAARELIGTDGWAPFILACAVSGTLGAAVCYGIGLTPADRQDVRARVRAAIGRPALSSQEART